MSECVLYVTTGIVELDAGHTEHRYMCDLTNSHIV